MECSWTYKFPHLLLASIVAGCFAFLPYVASASGPLPIAIDTGYVEITANPGDHLAKSFKFWNGTDAYLPLHLEASDFAPQGEEGQIVAGGEEDAANSLKTWVKPAIPDLNVAPKQEITLDFTIDVPENADPGSHWGTLLALTAPQAAGPGVGVRTGLGFIIYVRVLGEAREKLALESLSASSFVETVPIPVEARFRNEGTVHLAPEGAIEVRDMFGTLVATGTLPVRNVLPGVIRRVKTEVGNTDLWPGRYTVLLHATYGEGEESLVGTVRVWIVPWRRYGPWALVTMVLTVIGIWRRKNLRAFCYALWTGKPPPRKSDEGGKTL